MGCCYERLVGLTVDVLDKCFGRPASSFFGRRENLWQSGNQKHFSTQAVIEVLKIVIEYEKSLNMQEGRRQRTVGGEAADGTKGS